MFAGSQQERDLQHIYWREAGHKLLRHLVSLKALGKLSAHDLCVACHYCHEGGVLGADFSRFAGKPGLQSGRYSQILDGVLPCAGPVVFESIPCMNNKTSERARVYIPFAAVWEHVWTDVQQTPSMIEDAQTMSLPQIYHDHPVVQDAARKKQPRPLPLAVFLDGVRFTSIVAGRSDSVLGLWVVNLVTKQRYWFGGLRTNDICRCGCRGWDSIFPVLSCFAWQLAQLAEGRRFNVRQDQSEFDPHDPLVALRAERGDDLGFRCAVIWVKGDLAELGHTLGFPSVMSKDDFCPFCTACKDDQHDRCVDSRLSDVLWRQKSPADYARSCVGCSKLRVIQTEEQRSAVIRDGALTALDGRGYWGLTLTRNVPDVHHLNLQCGDRLEPCESMQDPHDFKTKPVPFQCMFWTAHFNGQNLADPVVHMCPLFDEVTGVTIDNLCIDALHTLYYGPVQRYASAVIWRVLLSNPWEIRGRTLDSRLNAGAARLRIDFMDWQTKNSIPHSERIGDWNIRMMGDRRGAIHSRELAHPGGSLKLKAAETGVVLLWACDLLMRHGGDVPFKDELIQIGASLVEYLDALRSYPRVPSAAQCARLYELMITVNTLSQISTIGIVPKHHFFYELTRRTDSCVEPVGGICQVHVAWAPKTPCVKLDL